MDTSRKKRSSAALCLAIVGCAGILAATAHASTWDIEVVDHAGSGRFSSLKLDSLGNAHLAYVLEDASHTLKYAFWDHSLKRWFVMIVATGASFCSLAVDSKQHPHISWADHGTSPGAKLRYSHFDGKRWETEAIRLSSEIIGYYTGIAVDSNDMPMISFYEYRGARGSELVDRLRVVTRDGKNWEVRTVDGEAQSGKFNSIAVDSRGGIHVAYANVSAMLGGMRYAFGMDKVWRVEVLEGLRENNGLYVGFSAAIAVDKDNNPHVTYMNQSNGLVKYAVRRAGKWDIQVVDRVAKVGYPDRNSITLDDTGKPYITYYDAAAGYLMIAYREGNKWIGEVIDSGASGFTSSVQVDNGMVWVSYADDADGGLKVARAVMMPPPPSPPPAPKTPEKATAAASAKK